MKKLAIIGASAAFAALPMVGVFAVPQPASQTDTVKITVQESCELAITGAPANATATMTVGTIKTDLPGSTFAVSCNTGDSWELNAQGTTDGTANALKGAKDGGNITSTDPATNLAAKDGSATTSDWGFKLDNDSSASEIVSGYENWKQIPTADTKIASGSVVSGTDKVKVTYGVSIGSTQKPDTYTGTVKYTLSQPGA